MGTAADEDVVNLLSNSFSSYGEGNDTAPTEGRILQQRLASSCSFHMRTHAQGSHRHATASSPCPQL